VAAVALCTWVGLGSLGATGCAGPTYRPPKSTGSASAAGPRAGVARPCGGASGRGATLSLPADLPPEVPLPALTLTGCSTRWTSGGTAWDLAYTLGRADPAHEFADESAVMRYTGFVATAQPAAGRRGGHGTYARGPLVLDLQIDGAALRLGVFLRSTAPGVVTAS